MRENAEMIANLDPFGPPLIADMDTGYGGMSATSPPPPDPRPHTPYPVWTPFPTLQSSVDPLLPIQSLLRSLPVSFLYLTMALTDHSLAKQAP